MNRRKLLKGLGISAASLPFVGFNFSNEIFPDDVITEWESEFTGDKTKDERFWKRFGKQFYQVSDEFINLENGYFGVQPLPVQKAYIKNIERVNAESSRYMRTEFNSDLKKIMEGLTKFSGVEDGELLITRNATEAMNILIQGLNLKKGDEVILHKQDYYSMIEAFQMLEKQIGIKVKYIRIPLLPESDQQIINLYEEAVTDKTKCILATHLIHLTGQIMPIKKMAEAFKPKGIEMIVDAAHSFAQLDYKLPDLGVDFVGVNLHKWFGNPLGVGMLYVKKGRIKDLKPLFGDSKKAIGDIKRLGHFGTPSTPTVMTVSSAQQFNEMITLPVKEKRLRYLQNYWTGAARKIDKVIVTTPANPARSCALASFRIEGMEAKETVKQLHERFNVFTVIRFLEDEEVVRVTPNLYNNIKEMDVLLDGLNVLAKS